MLYILDSEKQGSEKKVDLKTGKITLEVDPSKLQYKVNCTDHKIQTKNATLSRSLYKYCLI